MIYIYIYTYIYTVFIRIEIRAFIEPRCLYELCFYLDKYVIYIIYIYLHVVGLQNKGIQRILYLKALHCGGWASGGATKGLRVIKSVDPCALMCKFIDYTLVIVPFWLLPTRHLWHTVRFVIFKGFKTMWVGKLRLFSELIFSWKTLSNRLVI